MLLFEFSPHHSPAASSYHNTTILATFTTTNFYEINHASQYLQLRGIFLRQLQELRRGLFILAVTSRRGTS